MKFGIFNLALSYGWKLGYFRKESLFMFRRDDEKLTLIKKKGTQKWICHTVIHHPRQGVTKLRREIYLNNLEEIFDNPRMHTGVGKHMKLFQSEKEVTK